LRNCVRIPCGIPFIQVIDKSLLFLFSRKPD
jgi:hypothetical protein